MKAEQREQIRKRVHNFGLIRPRQKGFYVSKHSIAQAFIDRLALWKNLEQFREYARLQSLYIEALCESNGDADSQRRVDAALERLDRFLLENVIL